MGSFDRELPSLECNLPLGRPGLIAHNELVLEGWAVSPRGIAGVAVQIEERQWNASYGLDTPAIVKRVPEFPQAERAGYRLAIDTSGWTAGLYYVTVAAFDVEGGRSAIEGHVDVRPFEPPDPATEHRPPSLTNGEMAMHLDTPSLSEGVTEVEGPVDIVGWAHAEEGIEAVVVTIDGSIQYEALRPIVRPDLLETHGIEIAAEAGFALRLHPSECPPGRHSLSVVALGRDGGTQGVQGELVCGSAEATPEDAVGSPAVTWLQDRDEPAPIPDWESARSDPARATISMWEDRALLAEADAALSRTEADLAARSQERTARDLQTAREQLDSKAKELSKVTAELGESTRRAP
jgi:hypothetical protein